MYNNFEPKLPDLKDGDTLYYIKYESGGTPSISDCYFKYFGIYNEVYASIRVYYSDERRTCKFVYDYDIFDNIDNANIVLNYLTEANKLCANCKYEELASTVCNCKNCSNMITGEDGEKYCSVICGQTGLKLIPTCKEEPCRYYFAKYSSPYVNFLDYMNARNNCDYYWCIDSDCAKMNYLVDNKPEFYPYDIVKHNYKNSYHRRNVFLTLRIKNTDNYFQSEIDYNDFADFNFINDGKIMFDKLFVFQGKDRLKRNKYNVCEVNKFLCKNNITKECD